MKRINCSGSRSAELTVSTKLKYQYHGSHVYTWKCQGRCWWAAFNCMPRTWVERRIPRLEQAYWGKGRQNHEVMFKLNFSHSHNHPRISEALTPHKLAIRNRGVEIVNLPLGKSWNFTLKQADSQTQKADCVSVKALPNRLRKYWTADNWRNEERTNRVVWEPGEQ